MGICSCPMGHEENLSHREMAKRLDNDDFECRREGCSKNITIPVDSRFWKNHVLGRDRKPHVVEGRF